MRQPALRLRVTLGQEPELRCPHCGEWWQLTPDKRRARLREAA